MNNEQLDPRQQYRALQQLARERRFGKWKAAYTINRHMRRADRSKKRNEPPSEEP